MPHARRALLLACLAVVLGVLSAALKLANGDPPLEVATILSSGVLYLVVGLLASLWRPERAIGVLMIGVAIALYLEDVQLAHDPVVRVLGLAVASASTPVLYHLVLAYPTGRLGRGVRRWLAVAAYVIEIGGDILRIPMLPLIRPYGEVVNPVLVGRLVPTGDAIRMAQQWGGAALIVAAVVVVARVWWRANPPLRRALGPVYLPGIVIAAVTVTGSVADQPENTLGLTLKYGSEVTYFLWPLGFLLGVYRMRVAWNALSDVAAGYDPRSGSVGLEAALRVGLGDPALRILPPDTTVAPPDGLAAFEVTHDGERVAWIEHDIGLAHDPRLISGTAAVVGLALHSARMAALAAEQRDEVQQSRARIAEAGLDARRQLERDLHDGAQQRLLAAIIRLRMAEDSLAGGSDVTADLARCTAELEAALAELRELARGVHPAIVTDLGLAKALEDLVARSTHQVALELDLHVRPDVRIETAAYFAITEAVTNAIRHARATSITVAASTADQRLLAEVTDDGVGGADPAGSGLRGIADRVAALGGTLSVASPRGRGTRISLTLPLEAP